MSTMKKAMKAPRRAIPRGRIQPRRAGLSPRRTEMSRPVVTRPLWMQRVSGSYNFFYFHDGNKNVSDLVSYQSARGVPAHYEYAPFGAVTATSRSTPVTAYDFREYNPFRFSAECADGALGLLYYNYRHYNPVDGRWTSRDELPHVSALLQIVDTSLPSVAATRPNTALALWGRARPAGHPAARFAA